MKIVVVNEVKDLTKDKSYVVCNHTYNPEYKTVVNDSGYYQKVYCKDFTLPST